MRFATAIAAAAVLVCAPLAVADEDAKAEPGALGLVLNTSNPRPLPGVKANAPLGLPVVEVVPGGPSDAAGLKRDDVVIRIGSKAIKSQDDYKEASANITAGEPIKIAIKRRTEEDPNGATLIVTVTPITKAEARTLVANNAQRIADSQIAEAENRKKQKAEFEEARIAAMLARPPIEIIASELTRDIIDQPELRLRVRNNRLQAVDAYEATVKCFTKFGDPVNNLKGTNIFPAIAQTSVPAEASATHRWQLSWHTATGLVKLRIDRVKMQDGTVWKPSGEDEGWIEVKTK